MFDDGYARLRRLVFLTAIPLLLALPSAPALAACADPVGNEGEFIYNDDHNVMQFCNGTDWVGMAGGSVGSGGAVSLPGLSDVTITSPSDGQVLKYNSGVWENAADGGSGVAGSDMQVQFNDGGSTLAGAAQLFWDKVNNRLGVNTSTPAQALDISGAVSTNKVAFKMVTGAPAPNAGSGIWTTNGTDVWRSGGNVGIGTTTPNSKLHVKDGTNINLYVGNSSFGLTGVVINSVNDANNAHSGMTFAGSNFYFHGGNVGIGTTSPNHALHIENSASNNGAFMAANSNSSGDAAWLGQSGASGRVLALHKSGGSGDIMQAYFDPGGGYQPRMNLNNAGDMWLHGNIIAALPANPSANTMCYSTSTNILGYCSSDQRLKDEIHPLTNDALKTLMTLKPVKFRWKETGVSMAGFIAQDVQRSIPEAAKINPGSDYLALDTTAIVSYAVKAIQELKADNDNLRADYGAELRALRAELEALKSSLGR